MFNITIEYPTEEQELKIVQQTTSDVDAEISPC
jgi:hypothetical protein